MYDTVQYTERTQTEPAKQPLSIRIQLGVVSSPSPSHSHSLCFDLGLLVLRSFDCILYPIHRAAEAEAATSGGEEREKDDEAIFKWR